MNIVIAAGGTGGHLYPAVALAREFLRQEPKSEIVFIGTDRGIETKVLAHEGFELVKISALPVMGLGLLRSVRGLLSLPHGVLQSASILRARRPDMVIGIGGYSSPPVLLAASVLRIPRVILEPNAYPGMANRVLGPLAYRVFLAFDSAAKHFSPTRVRLVGTPIRRAFLDARHSPSLAAGAHSRWTLLIFGGSQGAHAINQAAIDALPYLENRKDRIAVVHQTGEKDLTAVKTAYQASGLEAEVVPFLFDMPEVLRRATLVVARAGAVTVAELTACGKPAILVPLPQAIYRHQERNARVMESASAAEVLLQHELTGATLAEKIDGLLFSTGRLEAMAAASRALGRTDAAELIVQECRDLVKRKATGYRHQTRP
jgi:UDP-N-acetylglucosamine--N-acetylmuramyl-(pentapeptide) pyrophosphoryl-undecaprenol N-acetylglucosamine transferase